MATVVFESGSVWARLTYTETVDVVNNRSTIRVTGLDVQHRYGYYGGYYVHNLSATVNGTTAVSGSGLGVGLTADAYAAVSLSGASISNVTVAHSTDGTKTVPFAVKFDLGPATGSYIGSCNQSKNVKLATIPQKRTLTISAGTGVTVTVKRTKSPSAGQATGSLSTGDTVYDGDVLQITATLKAGYKLTSLKVNGSTVSSGESVTVSSNVSVTASAAIQGSARIGSDRYLVYIGSDQYIPYIGDGSKWNIVT